MGKRTIELISSASAKATADAVVTVFVFAPAPMTDLLSRES